MTQLISVVDTHKLPQGLLSDLHLQSSLKYIDSKNYPTYQNVEKGLEYIGRKLIDIDEIVTIEEELNLMQGYGKQFARTTVAGNKEATKHSIVENGLKLNLLPISLVQLPNGKYGLADGETRYGIFTISCKLKNVIADVYTFDKNCSKEEQTLARRRFGIRANFNEAPSSPFTMEDLVKHTVNAVRDGLISKSDIKEEVERMNDNQFSLLKVNKMVLRINNVLEEMKEGIPLANTYDEKSAINWLNNIAKIQSNQNSNGIYYLTVSSSFGTKFIPWVARKYQELLNKIATENKTKCKQLRVLVYVSTLTSSDLEASWKTGVDKFRTKVKDLMNCVRETWFAEMPELDNKVILYGVIPAVYSLDEEYPMNKIVRFEQDLNNKTFDEIDTPKTLDDYLGID